MLRKALTEHKETVPSGFAGDVVKRARLLTQRELLAKRILRERLVLAGCILLPVTILVVMSPCPAITAGISAWGANLCSNILQLFLTYKFEWQTLVLFTIAAGFAVYSAFELFLTDR